MRLDRAPGRDQVALTAITTRRASRPRLHLVRVAADLGERTRRLLEMRHRVLRAPRTISRSAAAARSVRRSVHGSRASEANRSVPRGLDAGSPDLHAALGARARTAHAGRPHAPAATTLVRAFSPPRRARLGRVRLRSTETDSGGRQIREPHREPRHAGIPAPEPNARRFLSRLSRLESSRGTAIRLERRKPGSALAHVGASVTFSGRAARRFGGSL